MKKLFALAAIAAAAVGARRPRLPERTSHHDRRALRRRRPDRQGGARPGRGACASRSAASDHHRQRRPARAARSAPPRSRRPAPDGYTLLLHHIGMAHRRRRCIATLPFKTLESDFEYLGMVNDVPMTLIGKPSLPANNYAELTNWIDANKGKINLGNAGLGAASHLCGLLFQSAIKIEMTDRAVQGHGAGDDRPDRRPDRPDVRPDDQHHGADRSRQGQGLRRDHGQAPDARRR